MAGFVGRTFAGYNVNHEQLTSKKKRNPSHAGLDNYLNYN